jgi:hypothetical protein
MFPETGHEMRKPFPEEVIDAIASKVWRDPGPASLRQLLGEDLELPELELFEDVETMRRVAAQLEDAGYVDDPQFCMTHSPKPDAEPCDPRLVFGDAIFVAGSKVPGDDVFVAIDLHDIGNEPTVRVFDWRAEVPRRWVVVSKLREFVERLSMLS